MEGETGEVVTLGPHPRGDRLCSANSFRPCLARHSYEVKLQP